MKGFSIWRACSLGYRALAPRLPVHLVILAMVGILAPLVMQIMLREANAVEAGQTITGGRVPETATERLLTLFGLFFGYVLQSGSYFAAWRLSFRDDQPAVAAIAYGIMAGLLVGGLGLIANFIGDGAMGWLLDSPQMAYLGMIAFFLPLALLFALFYTVTAVMMAGVVVVFFILLVVARGTVGDSMAGLFADAGGGLIFLALVISVLTIWLSARMSCVAPLLAEQGGFNLPAAIGQSWRRTAETQWAILRHLALIGGGLGVLVVGASYLIGGGDTFRFLQPGGVLAGSQLLTILIHLAVGLPISFLTVLVPLGIYQQAEARSPAAEVFE